jgi:hypothetical protein
MNITGALLAGLIGGLVGVAILVISFYIIIWRIRKNDRIDPSA